jgi:hypothetical protein
MDALVLGRGFLKPVDLAEHLDGNGVVALLPKWRCFAFRRRASVALVLGIAIGFLLAWCVK